MYLTSTHLGSDLLAHNMMCIYTDVLTFDSPETILAPTADSMLVLAARVLTAEAPVTLKVHPALYIHPEPTSDGAEPQCVAECLLEARPRDESRPGGDHRPDGQHQH